MSKNNNQLKLVVNHDAPSIHLIDPTTNPGERSRWSRWAAMRRTWLRKFFPRYVKASEMTLMEVRSIEARVRKALYP
jgi:hypothetical protein